MARLLKKRTLSFIAASLTLCPYISNRNYYCRGQVPELYPGRGYRVGGLPARLRGARRVGPAGAPRRLLVLRDHVEQ